ncbi:hypothetical protein C0995_016623 [Termitomyces sp. Mi166|nr:hypothetical protein C0995_016623 [Termitomyces sp. Mi166\
MLQVLQAVERDETDRKRLEAEWGRFTLKARLLEKYGEETTAMVERFKHHFDSGIATSCADAASVVGVFAVKANASKEVPENVQKIVQNLSWQRLRAAFRRDGVYEDFDINREFTAPFISAIVLPWRFTLDQDVFPETSKTLESVTEDLLSEIRNACNSTSFKKTVTDRIALVLEETTSTLRALHQKVTLQIDKNQRHISGSITPHIKEQLEEGYEKALEYEGKGSVAFQKEYFVKFVIGKRETMFEDLHDYILKTLSNTADSVGEVVKKDLERFADKVYDDMSLLWQDSFIIESEKTLELQKKHGGIPTEAQDLDR